MARRFDHLADVEAFVAVVEHGSLTAGAIALSTTPSVLSRAISRLESRVGVQLLRGSTRRLGLTEAGRLYLEQAKAAFALMDEAERAIQGEAREVVGRVRLSAPTTYGHYRLPALLARFTATYPNVRLEVNITNRNVDLVSEGFDLAIRLGHLPDSGLIARKLEDASLCLVAAPDYLAHAGLPRSIDELRHHRCIPFLMPSTGRVAPWLFRDGERDVDWTPDTSIEVTDDVLGVLSLAEHGIGICQTYDFIARERIGQGRLVELLPQHRGRSRPFSLVYAPQRRMSAACRAMIDVLLEGARDPGREPPAGLRT